MIIIRALILIKSLKRIKIINLKIKFILLVIIILVI